MEQVHKKSIEKNDDDFESVLLQRLETEKKKIREEFDAQRAKMKELFLQKENELSFKNEENLKLTSDNHKLQTELDDVKSQLLVAGLTLESDYETQKRKADEEIASLQQLVCETVEESTSSKSIYDSEMKRLHTVIQHLQQENMELKSEKQSPHHPVQEQQSSLAPSVVLSAVTKKLARKLGADAFTSQDTMEDSISKVDGDHSQEDPEVLQSLIVPLEAEIKALKEKLRYTDEQLQKCRQCGHFEQESTYVDQSHTNSSDPKNMLHSTATNTSFDGAKKDPAPCDMCSNYEAELVKEQKRVSELEAKVLSSEKTVERHKEDLVKEIGFRKDMEEKWNEKREEHKQQVSELTTQIACAEQDLKELQQMFKQTCSELVEKLNGLIQEREKINFELDKLQRENDNLVGKYTVHSNELQSEAINLPDATEELHILVLKAQQDLIIAKIGKEAAEEKVHALQSDIMLLKDQITNDQHSRESLENSLVAEINTLKKQKDHLEKEKKSFLLLQEKVENLEAQLKNHKEMKKKLEDHINEQKTSIGSLQQELDTSEAVQKDFVRLSQNLQVQLEKIRDSDTQVRWQHDEDVEECPSCKSSFTVTKRKQHCRHCGQIFCTSCMTRSVSSGPNQRPSKVCDVCHTLLVKSSAPYFSTEVPHSPD